MGMGGRRLGRRAHEDLIAVLVNEHVRRGPAW